VLVLKPFVPNLCDPQRAGLVIAMASTFARNFTLVGSVANLILVYRASNRRIAIGFGRTLTLATLVVGLLRL